MNFVRSYKLKNSFILVGERKRTRKYPKALDNIYNCYIRDISILVRKTLTILGSIFGLFIQVGMLALKYSLRKTRKSVVWLCADKEFPCLTNLESTAADYLNMLFMITLMTSPHGVFEG